MRRLAGTRSQLQEALSSQPPGDRHQLQALNACLALEYRDLDEAGWSLNLDGRPGAESWGQLQAPFRDGCQLKVVFSRVDGSDQMELEFDDQRLTFQPASRMVSPLELLSGKFRPQLRFQASEVAYHLSSSLPGAHLTPRFRLPRSPWLSLLIGGCIMVVPLSLIRGQLQYLRESRVKPLVPATPLGVQLDKVPFGFSIRLGNVAVQDVKTYPQGQWCAKLDCGDLDIQGYSTGNVRYFDKNLERRWQGGDQWEDITRFGFPARRTPTVLWLRTPTQCLNIQVWAPREEKLAEFWDNLRVAPEFDRNFRGFQIRWPVKI